MGNVNKLRLLYIYKHLFRYSDEDHPVSTSELLKFLKDEYDMDVNRTTLPGDFAMMEMAGLHFEIVKSRQSPRSAYGRIITVRSRHRPETPSSTASPSRAKSSYRTALPR